MFPATLVLLLLILMAPAFILYDGPIVHGSIIAAASILTLIIALRIRAADTAFLSKVFRPVAIVAGVSAVYMLIQVLPLKIVGLANPIWESAASALKAPLTGSISIDPGQTLVGFARCLSISAIAFVAAAVALDRRHAEWILISLTAATTVVALMLIAGGFAVPSDGRMAHYAATDTVSLGIILALAAAIHMADRSRTQLEDQRSLAFRYSLISIACLVAVAICGVAFVESATGQAYFAVACGIATLIVAVIIRRFHFGPWGYSAIISVALVVAIAAIALQPNSRTMDLTLAFAAHAPAPLLAVSQRILSEASWAGTGVGTFSAVLPIYQDIGELTTISVAPTAAAAIAVEMGRPLLWATMLAAIIFVVILLRGASLRRRDSIYATAGASCIVAATLLAFSNTALFSTSFLIIIAAVMGLAFAQSKSRVA